MSGVISYSDARRLLGTKAGKFFDHANRWKMRHGGGSTGQIAPGIDWEASSPFGSVRSAVVLAADGQPIFDRPVYAEAPNVNLVVWGKGPGDLPHFAVVRQPRPHADDPEDTTSTDTLVFGQIVMGFNCVQAFGEDLVSDREVEDTARLKTMTKSGARVILDIQRPQYPYHNPNPTFVSTWSDLLFVEVDLDVVKELRPSRTEAVFSAEFVPVQELLRRIREGKDDQGAIYRMCTSNSALLIFFATHPWMFFEPSITCPDQQAPAL